MTLGDRVAVLEDGALQQVAPPMELYRRPANRFVAGFIGSPAMNLYDGELERADGGWRFSSPALTTTVEPTGELAAGRRVTLGIRPQDVGIAGGEAGAPARVALIEPIGSQQIVHFDLGAEETIVALSPIDRELEEGERARLTLPPAAIHLFDESGERLG